MNKKILRLAIPNIISNISIPLLSSVDTAVIGHLDDVAYLGAIAIGSMIFNFIYWGFGFLRMGTTGMTAQANGRKSYAEESNIFYRALLFSLLFGIILIGFQYFIKLLSFEILNASQDVELYAKEYFDIRIYAAPATLSLYVFHGWFLGMQNSKYPLILAVFVNVANVFLNLYFIYSLGMKSDGVALGTVISQYLGLILAIFLILYKYRRNIKCLSIRNIISIKPIKEYLKLNFDIFIRTLCLIFAFSFFTAKSAEFGNNILAVNTILLQLWFILAYGVDGFAFAAESLVGKYIGAKDFNNLKSAVKYSFSWGLTLGVFFTIVYLVFEEQLLWIFTDNELIVEIAMTYIIWTILAPLINSFCFIWDGVFIGATETKAMRNSMIISTLLIFLPTYYLLKPVLGNHSLWISMLLFMAARGLNLTIYAKIRFRKILEEP